MNRIYKTIWNHASGTATAVSELTAACGKRSSGRSGSLKNAAPRFRLSALSVALLLAGTPAVAATVENGTGTNSVILKGDTVTTATANGQDATAIGTGAKADEQSSFAAGTNAKATNKNAISIGTNSNASGATSTAVGQGTVATHQSATALGDGAQATNDQATAIGVGAKASQGGALAVGMTSAASAWNSSAFGSLANASGSTSLAAGYKAAASSSNSLAVGSSANARKLNGIAIGKNAQAGTAGTVTTTDADAIAIGSDSVAYEKDTVALGNSAKATADSATALGKGSKADSQYATAVGLDAHANGDGAVAMGSGAGTTGNSAVAVGNDAKATQTDASAFGHNAKATAERASAFGVGNTASGASSLSVGDKSVASAANAVAIGTEANAAGKNAVAAGLKANASNDGAVAIGANTSATNASTALGDGSKATGENSTALGWNANAAGRADVFIGKRAGDNTSHANNNSNIGIGEGAVSNVGSTTPIDNVIGIGTGAAKGIQAKHNIALGAYANGTDNGSPAVNTTNNVAIGERTRASGGNSIAVGNRTKAEGVAAIALGVGADAAGQNGFAAGQNTVASSSGTIAIGGAPQTANAAQATGVQGVAIGQQSQASHTASLALGKGAKAKHNNAVALGADSETEAAVGTTSATVNGITYSGFAGTTPTSTVSVGNGSLKRTVTNVAAGRINKTSTDAINGSQLYLTQEKIGNIGNTTKNILGGNAAMDADGNLTMTNIGGTGKNTIHEAIQAANNNANAANAGFKIAANGDASGITADNKTIKPDETLTIKGTGTGAFSNYDSDNIQTQVSADGTVTVGLKKDLTVNSVTAGDSKLDTNGLTITGGPSVTKAGIDAGSKKITNVADGTIGAGSKDAINGGQLHTALSNINNNIAAAKTEVKSSDGSVSVTPGTNAAGATVYDLAVKTDGTTITKAADGSLKANTTTLAPAANGSIAAPAATDAGKLVTAGDIANAINGSGFTLTTSASAGGAVSGTSNELVNPGKTVTIDAGKNISITQSGGKVSIATKDQVEFSQVTVKDAAGNQTVTKGNGVTITPANGGNAVSLTDKGLNNGGNKITNVAAGTDADDAVNVSQLQALENRLGNLNQANNQYVQQLDDKIGKVGDKANAGVAGAIAQGSIPQVTRPSAFGLGVGTGYYGGQSAIAVGASAMTDGGNWIFKGNFSVNTKGRVGAGAGALYQW